jgi:hypothetical protein
VCFGPGPGAAGACAAGLGGVGGAGGGGGGIVFCPPPPPLFFECGGEGRNVAQFGFGGTEFLLVFLGFLIPAPEKG